MGNINFEDFKFPRLVLEETLYTLGQLKNAAPDFPHIALAGRSNVGKSSLINALGRRKQLAKVSSTPGKTRSVNLYKVEPHGFYLTDLPGYGYAKRSKSERELWADLIEKYLVECENLAAMAILLDCRLEPQEADKMMVQFALAHAVPVIPILTKADKCTQKERSERISQWTVLIPRGEPVAVSSQTGFGLEAVWKKLIGAAGQSCFARSPAKESAGQEEKGAGVYEVIGISIEILSEEPKEQNGQAGLREERQAETAEPFAQDPEKPKKIRTKRGAAAREREALKKARAEKARIRAKAEKSRAKHRKKEKEK